MPEYINDEIRHLAALQLRQRTRDAALEGNDPDDDSESHVHIHLHRGDGDLPSSIGNANPAPGNPVRVSSDEEPDELDEPEEEGEGEQVIGQLPEPPEGQKYDLRENSDGSCDIIVVPD